MTAGVTRRTRIGVYGFLAVVVLCGLLAIEAWPLTGFRLYHELRTPTHPSWELAGVDTAGGEIALSLYDLPIAYRTTERLLGRDPDALEPTRADAVCGAWAAAFGARDPRLHHLRVYRTRIDARSGERLQRRLVHECRVETGR